MTQVQRQIAKRAKLTIAPWDGYLKYYNLGTKVRCVLSLVCTVRAGLLCPDAALTLWPPASAVCIRGLRSKHAEVSPPIRAMSA